MSGTKMLISGTLLLVVGILLGGIYASESMIMSLADTSWFFAVIRASIIILLISLLVTKPPRSHALRMLIGAWAIALAAFSVFMLFNYQLRLLDGVVFLEVALIFAIEALETRVHIPIDKKPSQRHRIPVATN